MTSKLVVNTIESDTGISSVSFASSISMSSTSKFFFSAAGIDIGADTNINRPASGVLGFNINSSEKVRITSAGSVGINSTSPDRRFTLHQDATCRMNLKSLSNSTAGIEFGDEADHNAGYIVYDNTNNSFQVGLNGTGEKLRISSEGYVTKPNNPAFRARSSSGGWKSFGNTNFNTMPFNAEDFDSGGNYNTSTYKFTVPVAGKYYFYCQMLHDGTTGNGANSGKMQIYVGSDIVTFAKSGTQGEIVSCSTVWDCTVGEEVYCQGATNTTNPDDWHGDSYYSYFTGYLIG